MRRRLKTFLATLLVACTLLPAAEARAQDTEFSILDTAELINRDTGEFSTLLAAVRAAGLGAALMDDGLTVFAPTDAAFAALGINADNIRTVISQEDLIAILQYHVAASVVTPEDLDRGRDVATLNGEIVVSRRKGIIYLNRRGNRPATVMLPPAVATNGVIYVIDAVLDPADAPSDDDDSGDKPKKKRKKRRKPKDEDPPKDDPPKDDDPKDDEPKDDDPKDDDKHDAGPPQKPQIPVRPPRERDYHDHDDYEDALEDYYEYVEEFNEDWEEVLEEYYEEYHDDPEEFYEELHEFYEEYGIPAVGA